MTGDRETIPAIPSTCKRCQCAMKPYPSVPDGFNGVWFRKCVFCSMAWDSTTSLFDGWVEVKK